jgi:hypothetical protein
MVERKLRRVRVCLDSAGDRTRMQFLPGSADKQIERLSRSRTAPEKLREKSHQRMLQRLL